MNKVYFAASVGGGREEAEFYLPLIEYLKKYGQVLTEHLADKGLTSFGEDKPADLVHDRDMGWLNESNIIVAEVTKASLGVGYEIGRTVERNLWVLPENRKDILCLYRPQADRRLSAMIRGSPTIKNAEYQTLEQAFSAIDEFFAFLRAI